MNAYSLINGLYGQVRGYSRFRVRREAMAAARMTREELAARQKSLFQERVCDAVRLFPAYAAKVKAHCGKLPCSAMSVDPADLPMWTREDQNSWFESLDSPPIAGSFVNATGGSTGVPLRYWVTRHSWEWRTEVSDRGYSWAHAQKGVRSLYVWGTAIHPPGRVAALRGRMSARLQGRTYLDSFKFGDEQKRLCCTMANRLQPSALVGYTGNLVELATFVREHPGLLRWKARTLVTAAEGLHKGQRELLCELLADEVFASYGSREFMLIGMECRRHRGYHISSDNLLVEVVDQEGKPVSPGVSGRIVISDLRNRATPFIRYEIGDLGAMSDPGYECPCGLPFPVLERVDGRIQEVISRPDGQKMTALFIPHLMKEFAWIDGYQIQQGKPGQITVSLVTGGPLDDSMTRPIADALRGKLGREMSIGFSRVKVLQRNASGKTPIVIQEKGT